ncbi:MAG TPA: PPC domain-containing protein [Thermoanaerobaculia bacterium]
MTLLSAVILMAGAVVLSSDNPSRTLGKSPKPWKVLSRRGSPGALALSACNEFGTLACPGSSANGEISTDDCRLDDGSYVDLIQFQGTAGQTVTIDMTSNAFDTYLYLLDPTPVVVASNDDSGGSTNSRITFTLTASGTWTIGATSFLANELGTYTLTIQCTTGPSTTPTPTATAVPPAPTFTPIPGPCVANATTLCLNNGRFRVQANYSTPAGQAGPGMAVTQTSDTGLFWFFSANNIEVIVKVVNACTFTAAPRYWVFAGGLTNVAVVLTVTDTQTGTVRTYTNPQNTPFAPIQATNAFATCP